MPRMPWTGSSRPIAIDRDAVKLFASELRRDHVVVVQAVLWLSTLIYATATILGAVFETESVEVETLLAALCAYLLLGLIWVYFYALIALASPDSFRFRGGPMVAWSDDQSRRAEIVRLLNFSYSKLTSASYDDLTAAGGFTNICTCLEALIAQVYLAVVIARLFAMQVDRASRGPPTKTDEKTVFERGVESHEIES
jgi:hypothetical protein